MTTLLYVARYLLACDVDSPDGADCATIGRRFIPKVNESMRRLPCRRPGVAPDRQRSFSHLIRPNHKTYFLQTDPWAQKAYIAKHPFLKTPILFAQSSICKSLFR